MDSLPGAIEKTARRFPDKTAVLEPAEPGHFRSVTSGQLWNNVEWAARGILALNPKPVVALAGDNSIQWYTAYLAVMRAGGVVVPIDRELPPAEHADHRPLLRGELRRCTTPGSWTSFRTSTG
jgi:long-chain acyl-CoA synthetase